MAKTWGTVVRSWASTATKPWEALGRRGLRAVEADLEAVGSGLDAGQAGA
jgi:hypothetical protein